MSEKLLNKILEKLDDLEKGQSELLKGQKRIEEKINAIPVTYEKLEISIGNELQEHKEILKELTYIALKHDTVIKRIK